jgi:(1->4)-alpha-D-glucan 1-alpha-D-glucosylmutase
VNPVVATARLQLGPDLDFAAAGAVVPYLAQLGVSHLYLSPVFAARPGSTHGYDIVDPTRVSDALGGRAGLERLAAVAHEQRLGLVLDIVPNHLVAGEHNPWWWSVLRDGEASPHGHVFDVDWSGNAVASGGRIVLPVLGRPLADELAAGALRIDRSGAEPRVRYHDRSFPIAPGTGAGELAHVLDRQHYALAWWRDAARSRSYRRFLDIDDLVGVRVEDPTVFDATHSLIVELVRAGIADGLRIDHIDGLADPAGYLGRLRSVIGDEPYVVVEDVLAAGQDAPPWPVEGTTGYDALAALDAVFVDPFGLQQLDADYRDAGGRPFAAVVLDAKRLVLDQSFAPEVDRLGVALAAMADLDNRRARELVCEITCHLDVYRTYARGGDWSTEDWERVESLLERTGTERPQLERVLQGNAPDAVEWVTRWQQLTGAVMAKGYEDTALYRHTRLLALNEVGGHPDGPLRGDPRTRLQDANAQRRERSPGGMVTTTTHDTKRGEDTRARLLGLSERPGEWRLLVRRLREMLGLDLDTVQLVAQTALAGWPPMATGWPDYAERIAEYLRKALREAKVHTSWLDPDVSYEDAVIDAVLPLLAQLELAGVVHALGRTVLKHAAPGVADLYQGAERWMLTFVDPDNRRPVDWRERAEQLARWDREAPEPGQLLGRWRDGTVKQWVTWRTLRARGDDPDLFLAGQYLPLVAGGRFADHVVAFARVGNDARLAVAVATRLPLSLTDGTSPPLGAAWDDTALVLPQEVVAQDVLRPGTPPVTADHLPLADVFTDLPAALLVGRAAP